LTDLAPVCSPLLPQRFPKSGDRVGEAEKEAPMPKITKRVVDAFRPVRGG
jgi:hypothetical protein